MDSTAIARLLPAAYQRAAETQTVLAALLSVMEDMHAPSERRLATVEDLFAPYRAPEEFLGFLAGWVAMDHLAGGPGGESGMPAGRLRDLIAAAAGIARWRGTAHGLRSVLEIATGVTGFVVEEPADRPFHVVVRVPSGARAQSDLVRRIVEAEKPAAVTCEVVGRQLGRPGTEEKA